jgi:FkbM family methyltransferase
VRPSRSAACGWHLALPATVPLYCASRIAEFVDCAENAADYQIEKTHPRASSTAIVSSRLLGPSGRQFPAKRFGVAIVSQHIIKFCRLRLGAKPFIDYAQSRRKLLGIADLPIQTVFDIGANIGKKSRLYHKLFPQARIYCFEPVPRTYQRLARWAAQQNGAVQTFNMALGSVAGETSIHWNQKHSGGSTLLEPALEREHEFVEVRVPMETLDRVAQRLDIREQIFVKIDVEGFDMEVVKGGIDLIRRASAVMIEIGLSESPNDLPTFRDFVNVLDTLGYMYRGNLSHGYVNGIPHLADAVFIKPPEARRIAA